MIYKCYFDFFLTINDIPNLYLIDLDGNILLPFDWESSGFGDPAHDLENLDITTYQATVSQSWLSFDMEKAYRLAEIGKIYRLLMLIYWSSENLVYPWAEKPIRKQLRFYYPLLSKSIQAIGWQI